MPRRRLHQALIGVLAAVALAAGLASAHTAASAEDDEATTPRTVTAVLHPGWNMVGWIGLDAPVSDLFEVIPALESVATWDADGRRYRWARRGGVPPSELRELRTGMGLWMRLGGDVAVEWQRTPAEDYVLLELRAGRNLVAWTGEGGESVTRVARRLGLAFIHASRWDAGEQRQATYKPDELASKNTLSELDRGDALWVEISSDARWWQSGTGRTAFRFPDGVTAEKRAQLRDDLEVALAFFAERYGIEPPEFTVSVIRDLPNASTLDDTIRVSDAWFGHERFPATLAHEYVHILQRHWGQTPGLPRTSPRWLFEGTAVYAMLQVAHSLGVWTAEETLAFWRELPEGAPPLRDLEHYESFHAQEGAYGLGSLAVEWLMGHAAAAAASDRFTPVLPGWKDDLSGDAYLRYWRTPEPSGRWQDALATTFGIAAEDFYAGFESYRAVMRARLAPGDYHADPSTVEGPALIEDQRIRDATLSILLDAAGDPIPGAWVAIYKRGLGYTTARVYRDATAEAIVQTDPDGTFDSSKVAAPHLWSVVTGGCRLAGGQLAVRQIGPTAFEIRLRSGSTCDAS